VKRRHLLRLGAIAPACLALPQLATAASTKIVLGQSAAFSGPASALGERFKEGALLAFDRVNARGGINGRTIELRSMDDGYEPDRCADNTQRLLRDDVFTLFGYVGTPTSMAALPLATAARVPFFAPFSGAEALRVPFNRMAFHVRASYFDETAEIVKQVTSVGIRRIGVFYQNDSYGKTGLDGTTAALKAHNLKPVGLGTVERNTVNVNAAVQAILADQPEAIVQISAYTACAAFIRAARLQGFKGGFYNVSFVGTQALMTELGRDARGVAISQVMPLPFSAKVPLSADYLATGRLAGKKFEPNYGGIEGFAAARTLIAGLQQAGTGATPETLATALENMPELNLGGFFINFSDRSHAGSKFVDMTILTAEGDVRH
jgi:ABC-type branched-subunit amino acid transport system substrate-binding protein